jgi:hypothetical protein
MAAPRAAHPSTRRRRTLIAVAAVAAIGIWAWLGLPQAPIPSQGTPLPDDGSALDVSRAPSPTIPEPQRESPAATKLRELRAMSETFRNTTFLGAIRTAGFVCYALENVYGGVNDSTTWTVSCADMLAYTVSVDNAGALVVDPMIQFPDSPPFTTPRDELPLTPPPPQRLLPPPR